MTSTNAYLIGFVVLVVVAAVFAILWFMAYMNYTSLEIRYVNLQNQYTNLQSQYQALEAKYNKLITALASAESYSGIYYLNPGNITMFEFIVPKGYNAAVNINISSSDSLAIVVAPLNVFNEERSITSWTQAQGVTFYMGYTISKSIILSPGSYFIVVICSSVNEFGAYVYVNITTTLTPTS